MKNTLFRHVVDFDSVTNKYFHIVNIGAGVSGSAAVYIPNAQAYKVLLTKKDLSEYSKSNTASVKVENVDPDDRLNE